MASFLEDVNQMVIDACYQDIAEQLLEDWINSNLDEGQYYADKQFAEMSGDEFIYAEFNKFYNISNACFKRGFLAVAVKAFRRND